MRDPIIGIDLGTTNSVVATVEEGRPRVIPSRVGGRLTPSVVGFTPNTTERVVGAAAQALASEHPDCVVWATKRFIGRRFTPELVQAARSVVPYPILGGTTGDVRVKMAGRTVPVTQVAAMILGELKLDAEAYFGREANRCVITVPANFDDGQRQATREAAAIAGLDVLRLINEPTAAALAYGLSRGFQGHALVFDLGGGTFDVTVLEVTDGVYEVKATGGDSALGGEDFDLKIVDWLLSQIDEPLRESVHRDVVSQHKLKVAAEQAKRELSEYEETLISLAGLGDQTQSARKLTGLETVLTRSYFNQLCESLSERCLAVCRSVMRDAGLKPSAVDTVLLVGGMTRVPLIRQLVTDFFGKPPSTEVNPDEAVALGAAIQADELARQSGAALLLDVVSNSLGVGVLGGKVRRLIPRNRSVPVVAREIFHPGRHGQTEARIPVYQGESDLQDENRKLGEVVLRNLQAGSRADTSLEVTFELSNEGLLAVRAVDLQSGLSEEVRMEARPHLPAREADRLVKEQAAYAQKQAQQDARKSEDKFRKLLERGEKLARLLQHGAEENPGEEAQAAVANVRSLLESGRAALEAQDAERCAQVARQLTQLLAGR
ncbi:molecular chaperone DnaK [Cystobacter fuscus]|uniref:Molecular chaperone DnaK n=1 Tax=Cystobacter fuscus TaxID=43 RepID=A0A250IW61_9BACT|nr:Hsp70 family protein [Cystobacter fuscus]ATB35146.1 molecular chaperone DnaK [Cystobacter fuscus]